MCHLSARGQRVLVACGESTHSSWLLRSAIQIPLDSLSKMAFIPPKGSTRGCGSAFPPRESNATGELSHSALMLRDNFRIFSASKKPILPILPLPITGFQQWIIFDPFLRLIPSIFVLLWQNWLSSQQNHRLTKKILFWDFCWLYRQSNQWYRAVQEGCSTQKQKETHLFKCWTRIQKICIFGGANAFNA